MKKLSIYIAAGAMALLLAACNNNNAPKQPEVKPATTTEQAAQPAPANEAHTNTDGATSQE
jgi:PBP1b-binding outer membrane lipoprotein LpoB